MFETASRKKYRFPYKGLITVEDLWDLSNTQLDNVYKALVKEASAASEDSLLNAHAVSEDLQNKIDIVKHIFSVKQAEYEKTIEDAAKYEKKRRLLEALEKKQDEAIMGMSEEELKAAIAAL